MLPERLRCSSLVPDIYLRGKKEACVCVEACPSRATLCLPSEKTQTAFLSSREVISTNWLGQGQRLNALRM